MLVIGTASGVYTLDNDQPRLLGLEGCRVTHVAERDGTMLAAIPKDGLYRVEDGAAQRMWEGDARSCALGPDGAWYVGSEPAMIHRSDDLGARWVRCDAIDQLPTRGEWTFPPPPHEPHVLSIDFIPGEPEGVLAGIEVGGVIYSPDRGETWEERNNGIYVDVHSARIDPSHPGRVVAVTGAGFYASEDGGQSWERRMYGIDSGYTVGLAVQPGEGDLLVAAGTAPPGVNARLFHSNTGGHGWTEIRSDVLPEVSRRAMVPFFTVEHAWLGAESGTLFRSPEPEGPWAIAGELPAGINCLAAGGCSSSVMH